MNSDAIMGFAIIGCWLTTAGGAGLVAAALGLGVVGGIGTGLLVFGLSGFYLFYKEIMG